MRIGGSFVIAIVLAFLPACRQSGSTTSSPASVAQPVLQTEDLTPRGTESHGGSIVYCPARRPQAVVLDYYHANLPTYHIGQRKNANLFDLSHFSEKETVDFFIDRIGDRYFATQLREVVKLLKLSSSWISADLKDLDDGNEPYALPRGCSRRRVATRQGDHEMFIDPAWAKLLSPWQLGVLDIHEAVYYLASHLGLNTSDRVRALIREVLSRDHNQYSCEFSHLIRDVGGNPIAGSIFDSLSRGTYLAADGTKIRGGKPLSIYFRREEDHGQVSNGLLLYLGQSRDKNWARENMGRFRCGGVPLRCYGYDLAKRDIELRLPGDDSNLIQLSWFYHDQWTVMMFVQPDRWDDMCTNH